MSTVEPSVPTRASNRLTARLLTLGSALSFAAFAVAFLADLADGAAVHTRGALTIEALIRVDPETWALVAVLTLFATPAAGLLATVAEYRRSEPRMSLVGIGVLALLTVSIVIALAR